MSDPAQAQVRQLVESYGPTVTAVVSGTRRLDDVTDWLNGVSEPTDAQRIRISEALRILKLVETESGKAIAAAWLIASNTCHNDEWVTPMAAIREGNFAAAESSAMRLNNDSWS